MSIITVSGAADPSGNLSLTFPVAGLGEVYTGTLSVPDSPPAAAWKASVAGESVQSWVGTSMVGPLTTRDAEQLTISGTGLGAGEVYQAKWHAAVGRTSEITVYPPSALPTSTSVASSISGDVTVTNTVDVAISSSPTLNTIDVGGIASSLPFSASLSSSGTEEISSATVTAQDWVISGAASAGTATVSLYAGNTSSIVASVLVGTSPAPVRVPLPGLSLSGPVGVISDISGTDTVTVAGCLTTR